MKDMLKRGVFVLLFIVFSSSAYSLIGDFDLNNEVNFNDFVQFARAFGEFNVENSEGETFYDSHFDLNNDGIISIEDFFIFADNFGKTNETNVSERIFATKPLAPTIVNLEKENLNCEKIRNQERRDYCWDRQAIINSDKLTCDNIRDSQLKEFCKYRVDLFNNKNRILRVYHVELPRQSDMNLDKHFSDTSFLSRELKELSKDEYNAISKRDKKVVIDKERLHGFLFVIDAPENQKFAKIEFGLGNVFLWPLESQTYMDITKDVYIRTKTGGTEYENIKSDSVAVPVIDGKISFIFDSAQKNLIIDQAFEYIVFAQNKEDLNNPYNYWGGAKLQPSGEFKT